ncbi:MAG: hypothetical protein OHK0029_03690 [Armatimonadaceae bacterium]
MFAALGIGAMLAVPGYAQQGTPAQTRTTNRNEAAPAGRQVSLKTVLTRLSRESGIDVVADRSVAMEVVTEPTETATAENLELLIADTVRSLPGGTVWAKLYLPAAKRGRGFDGDAVADYALAQAKLFGNVGGSTPDGTIEVMGQKVQGTDATTVSSTLNLKPVYVLVHPGKRSQSPMAGSPSDWSKWSAMTPEEREKYSEQQARQLLNMDPSARMMYFDQMRSVMMSLMNSIPPDQRREFFQSMMGGREGGMRPGRPGGRPRQ